MLVNIDVKLNTAFSGAQTSASVTTITVQFINFDDFCLYIPKIRNRFPNATVIKKQVINHYILFLLENFSYK